MGRKIGELVGERVSRVEAKRLVERKRIIGCVIHGQLLAG